MKTPIEPKAEKKPVFGCKICRHRAPNRVGRIVSDWFKIPWDDRSWCYVMYENEAGHTHMVEYAEFFLPEGHQHYDLKIDVLENPVGTLEAQNKKMKEFLLKGSRTKIKTGDTEEEIVIFSAQDMDTLTLLP